MQPLVFWVEMGGKLGGEMPTDRAFGPRNVMNNRGVVRTRSLGHCFGSEGRQRKGLSCISDGVGCDLWLLNAALLQL